jgi:uncharacterized membrane protein
MVLLLIIAGFLLIILGIMLLAGAFAWLEIFNDAINNILIMIITICVVILSTAIIAGIFYTGYYLISTNI